MSYVVHFLCDICGHKWKTRYARLKLAELGNVCENCRDRPPHRKNYSGHVVEPHFYERVES